MLTVTNGDGMNTMELGAWVLSQLANGTRFDGWR